MSKNDAKNAFGKIEKYMKNISTKFYIQGKSVVNNMVPIELKSTSDLLKDLIKLKSNDKPSIIKELGTRLMNKLEKSLDFFKNYLKTHVINNNNFRQSQTFNKQTSQGEKTFDNRASPKAQKIKEKHNQKKYN
ncbi:hypothetical protein OAT84_01580 [Gammaproteobacteria bacterium]|nr:hypothetical protein [Gammaproteobacteria bacterium]